MRTAGRAAALVVVVALLSLLGVGTAAAARTVDVVLTAGEPPVVSIAAGDTVRFVSGETGPLAPPHQVTATQQDGSTEWQFDSGPLGAGQSATFTFASPGTYLYVDRRGLLAPSERTGRVVVVAPAPSAAPAPAPAPAAPPPAAPPPAATTAPAAPAPAGTAAALPPLTGGVSTAPLGGLPAQPAAPPAIADLLRTPVAAPTPAARLPAVQALQGPLPGAPTDRGLGLPATLAALAALGVVSLLVRVLLAEPAARRRPLAPVAVA